MFWASGPVDSGVVQRVRQAAINTVGRPRSPGFFSREPLALITITVLLSTASTTRYEWISMAKMARATTAARGRPVLRFCRVRKTSKRPRLRATAHAMLSHETNTAAQVISRRGSSRRVSTQSTSRQLCPDAYSYLYEGAKCGCSLLL